ncbi:helix-turn-helix transcriptional regulator [Glycomyces scopariae]
MADAKALRREIGRELEKMQFAAGIPSNEIRILKICGSTRTYGRLIKGERTNLTYPVIAALCDLFKAPPAKKFELQALWDVLDSTSFADSADAWIKAGFSPYLGFERIAVRQDMHELVYVPGLFQTERYMRRLHGRNGRLSRTEANDLVKLRLQRQQDFEDRGEPAVEIRALLHEGVLRAGCDEEQIGRLLALDERPNIAISFLPLEDGPHPNLSASFTLFSFLSDKDPDVVYLPAPGESRFAESARTVRACQDAFESGFQQAKSIRELNR